jgi:hypothetical protein
MVNGEWGLFAASLQRNYTRSLYKQQVLLEAGFRFAASATTSNRNIDPRFKNASALQRESAYTTFV